LGRKLVSEIQTRIVREVAQRLQVCEAVKSIGKRTSPQDDGRVIANLQTYPDQYVTVPQLARYWRVGRKHIHKQIDAGTLRAIRFGPRLLRVLTADAIHFEHMVKTTMTRS
jgi:excisionase family DNA binding protein